MGMCATHTYLVKHTAIFVLNRRATGNQIGREGRAFLNQGNADATFWAPVINLASDPRWGRNLETAGEDPLAAGDYAVEFVRGFQTAREAATPLQVRSPSTVTFSPCFH